MGFYYDIFIKNIKNSGIVKKDTIHSCMKKLEANIHDIKQLSKVKNFVRKYWNFERSVLDTSYLNYINNSNKDPIQVKGDKFILFNDAVFQVCHMCKGRLFSDFTSCPFCSANLGNICEIIPADNSYYLPKLLYKNNGVNGKKFNSIITYDNIRNTLECIDNYLT